MRFIYCGVPPRKGALYPEGPLNTPPAIENEVQPADKSAPILAAPVPDKNDDPIKEPSQIWTLDEILAQSTCKAWRYSGGEEGARI
jgi:hypothetical protein